jgi:hypothetical protein
MPAYAVLEPPRRNRSADDHTDRFVFLREKFSPGAFLFGPVWMIWRRLWVVLIIYVVIVGLIEYGLRRAGIAWPIRATVYFFIQLLIGLEATSLRHWTRIRRGWRDCGVVIADDLEMAERRFFDTRAARRSAARTVEQAATSPLTGDPMGPVRPDIIGLFPEPGGGR